MRGTQTLTRHNSIARGSGLGAQQPKPNQVRRRHSADWLLRLLRLRALRCAPYGPFTGQGYFYNGIFLVWAHGPTGAMVHGWAAIASGRPQARKLSRRGGGYRGGGGAARRGAIAVRLRRWRIRTVAVRAAAVAAERAVVVVDHTPVRRSAVAAAVDCAVVVDIGNH